jgi:hypothetical protein
MVLLLGGLLGLIVGWCHIHKILLRRGYKLIGGIGIGKIGMYLMEDFLTVGNRYIGGRE